ncbi:MAG: sigma-70 family RNA polymerase sigma factor [Proteobacteria bacterium]|nr:sigma-70 family RNA polymerase sigma factor [Pseudomonadota bacterium]
MDARRSRFEAQALPHLDAAYGLALCLTRSSNDAEDIAQEAMLRAWRAFDGFRGADIKPWLLAIVRNCWRTAGARNQRHAHAELPDDDQGAPATEEAGPEELAAQLSQSRRLDEVMALLPVEYREVLILREVQDLSYREIADVAGIPIGTVMSRLARARVLLRERWLARETP